MEELPDLAARRILISKSVILAKSSDLPPRNRFIGREGVEISEMTELLLIRSNQLYLRNKTERAWTCRISSLSAKHWRRSHASASSASIPLHTS